MPDRPVSVPKDGRGLWRTVLALTWPQLCVATCQMVIGLTDVWAAGRIGSDAQASIGLVTQLQIAMLMLGFASANGAVAAVSQSLGARRPRRARRYVALVLGLAVGIGAGIACVAFPLRPQLLALLRTPDAIRPLATDCLDAMLTALPGHYGVLIGAAMFRSAQSVILPMHVALLTCTLNVVGDLGFGLGMWGCPAFGTAGIVWSTTIAAHVGAMLTVAGLVRRGLLTADALPSRRWARSAGRYLVKVTVPALGTSFVWQSGYLLMFVITASLPTGSVAALAGLTGGLRAESLLFMPATACGMTAGVLVGDALGKGDRGLAMRVAMSVTGLACAAAAAATLGLWPFRESLAGCLSDDPAVVTAIIAYLTYNLAAGPCSVAGIVLTGALNGAGASVFPMRVFLLGIWGVRLPVAYGLGHLAWGTCDGVFAAMMLSQFVQASCLLLVILKCDWRAHAMRARRNAMDTKKR